MSRVGGKTRKPKLENSQVIHHNERRGKRDNNSRGGEKGSVAKSPKGVAKKKSIKPGRKEKKATGGSLSGKIL